MHYEMFTKKQAKYVIRKYMKGYVRTIIDLGAWPLESCELDTFVQRWKQTATIMSRSVCLVRTTNCFTTSFI